MWLFIIAGCGVVCGACEWSGAEEDEELTVDGNGHGLGQDVAVGALESRDLAQLVELAVVIGDVGAWLGLDKLEVKTVGLGDGEDGGGARVALEHDVVSGVHTRVATAKVLFVPMVGGQ